MAYGIWLSFNNQEEGFQIPVNPGSIEMSDGSSNKTYNVVGLGEINVIKEPKLTEYTFSSFFPAAGIRSSSNQAAGTVTDPFVTSSYLLGERIIDGNKVNGYVYYLLKWMASKRPIRFVFTGDSFDINTPASIEAFDWKEVAGGGGDIEYTLKLKKYVFYAPQKVQVVKPGTTATTVRKVSPPRQSDKQTPKTYPIKSGDTLWTIAKSQLGNGDRWKEIKDLNNISDSKVKSLSVGTILKLPTGTGGVAVA